MENLERKLEIRIQEALRAEKAKQMNSKVRTQTIATLIYNSLLSSEITQKDVTAADELIRGLTFEKYEEKTVSKVMIGIEISDFEALVERISERHSIPQGKKEGILDGQFAQQNTLKIKEFLFNVGTDSKITYCKIATIKTSSTLIDMALVLFQLDFKLSPTVLETIEDVALLGFIPWGKKKRVDEIERYLSEQDQNKLIDFFRAKALYGFTKEYPNVVNDKSNAADVGQLPSN